MTQAEHTNPQDTGCGRQIAWFGAGFVLPFYSPEFYIFAIRRPLRSALVFFGALMTLVSALTSARIYLTVDHLSQQAIQALDEGRLDTITITDGAAAVEGDDPFMINDDDRFFFAIDTKGALDRDALLEYDGGVLITGTIIYSYGGGRSQGVELSNYSAAAGGIPLVFDEVLFREFFGAFSILYQVIAGIGIWLWNVGLWLLFLAISAYLLWGPIHQALPEFSFRAVLTIGIYAHLPAYIIKYVLTLFNIQPIFLYTTLLLVFWVGALYLVLREVAADLVLGRDQETPKERRPQAPAQPPRLWPAWLGLPALGFISANAVFNWEFAPLYVLGGLAGSIALLLFIDSVLNRQPEETSPAP